MAICIKSAPRALILRIKERRLNMFSGEDVFSWCHFIIDNRFGLVWVLISVIYHCMIRITWNMQIFYKC